MAKESPAARAATTTPTVATPVRPAARGGHGPSSPVTGGKRGSARLRDLLRLSEDVGVETMCDEAAQAIEQLRAERPAKSVWPKD